MKRRYKIEKRHKVAGIAVGLLLLSFLLARMQIGCAVDLVIHLEEAPFMEKLQGEYFCDAWYWSKTIPFEITPGEVLKIKKQKCWRNPLKAIYVWVISRIVVHGIGFEADTEIKLKVPKDLLFDEKSSGAIYSSKYKGFLENNVQDISYYYDQKGFNYHYIIKSVRVKSENGKSLIAGDFYNLKIGRPSSGSDRQKIDFYFYGK